MLTAETCLLVSFRKARKHLRATCVADSVCSNLFSKSKAFPDCSIPATPQKYLTLDTHLRPPRGPLLGADGDFTVQADMAPLPLTSCCGFSLGQLLTAVTSCTSGVLSCLSAASPRRPRPGCAPSVSWDEWRGWGAGGGLCQARPSVCPSWARHPGETTQPAQSWLSRTLQGPDLRPVPLVVELL